MWKPLVGGVSLSTEGDDPGGRLPAQGGHVSVSHPTCSLYHVRYHPEEEGRWALPHGEFGLDLIAKIGAWRFTEHRSVPEMHQRLLALGISITEREVTHLMHRYARVSRSACGQSP